MMSASSKMIKSEFSHTPPTSGSKPQAIPSATKNHFNNLNSKTPKQKSKTNNTNNTDQQYETQRRRAHLNELDVVGLELDDGRRSTWILVKIFYKFPWSNWVTHRALVQTIQNADSDFRTKPLDLNSMSSHRLMVIHEQPQSRGCVVIPLRKKVQEINDRDVNENAGADEFKFKLGRIRKVFGDVKHHDGLKGDLDEESEMVEAAAVRELRRIYYVFRMQEEMRKVWVGEKSEVALRIDGKENTLRKSDITAKSYTRHGVKKLYFFKRRAGDVSDDVENEGEAGMNFN
jgi:hypothetical protein